MNEVIKDYKVYDGAKVINSSLGSSVIIGEDSFVKDCCFENKVQINRRNFIIDTKIGRCTYTGMNTVIKHADIGRFCSVSWNVACGGASHDYEHISTSPFYQLKQFGFVDENADVISETVQIGNDVWIGMNSCIIPGGGKNREWRCYRIGYSSNQRRPRLCCGSGKSGKNFKIPV